MNNCLHSKSIIILEHEPLTPRLREAWMIDDLMNNGIEVEYWDLSAFTDIGMIYPNKISADFIKSISSFSEFRSLIRSIDVSKYIFFVEIAEGWCSFSLYQELKRNNCFCVKYELYASVAYPQKHRTWNRLKLAFTKIGLYYKSFTLFNNLTGFFDYKDVFSPCNYRYRTVPVNHPDYEKFVRTESYTQTNYIVFLDIYYPLHPDYVKFGDGYKNPQHYWTIMNGFFDKVERKYNKEIIIAAHPKSEYAQGTFGGRRIIVGKTCELVKGCDGVIMHDSASINFAVLANKPVFMGFAKEQLNNELARQGAMALSNYTGIKIHNLDDITEEEIEFKPLLPQMRDRFIYNMLTSEESKGKYNYEIVSQYIQLK